MPSDDLGTWTIFKGVIQFHTKIMNWIVFSYQCCLLVLVWISLISIRFSEMLFTYIQFNIYIYIQYLDTLISFPGFPSCWFLSWLIYIFRTVIAKSNILSLAFTLIDFIMFYVKNPFLTDLGNIEYRLFSFPCQ